MNFLRACCGCGLPSSLTSAPLGTPIGGSSALMTLWSLSPLSGLPRSILGFPPSGPSSPGPTTLLCRYCKLWIFSTCHCIAKARSSSRLWKFIKRAMNSGLGSFHWLTPTLTSSTYHDGLSVVSKKKRIPLSIPWPIAQIVPISFT